MVLPPQAIRILLERPGFRLRGADVAGHAEAGQEI